MKSYKTYKERNFRGAVGFTAIDSKRILVNVCFPHLVKLNKVIFILRPTPKNLPSRILLRNSQFLSLQFPLTFVVKLLVLKEKTSVLFSQGRCPLSVLSRAFNYFYLGAQILSHTFSYPIYLSKKHLLFLCASWIIIWFIECRSQSELKIDAGSRKIPRKKQTSKRWERIFTLTSIAPARRASDKTYAPRQPPTPVA